VGSLPPCEDREIEVGIMAVSDGGRIHGWWNQFHRVIQETGMVSTQVFSHGTKLGKQLRSSFPTQLWRCEGRRQGSRWTPETAPL